MFSSFQPEFLDAVQYPHWMRCRAVVIALQHRHRICIGSDDSDAFDLGPIERKDAVILQQHQRFPRNLQGNAAGFRACRFQRR